MSAPRSRSPSSAMARCRSTSGRPSTPISLPSVPESMVPVGEARRPLTAQGSGVRHQPIVPVGEARAALPAQGLGFRHQPIVPVGETRRAPPAEGLGFFDPASNPLCNGLLLQPMCRNAAASTHGAMG